jgi:hypothetical protein
VEKIFGEDFPTLKTDVRKSRPLVLLVRRVHFHREVLELSTRPPTRPQIVCSTVNKAVSTATSNEVVTMKALNDISAI